MLRIRSRYAKLGDLFVIWVMVESWKESGGTIWLTYFTWLYVMLVIDLVPVGRVSESTACVQLAGLPTCSGQTGG